MTAHLDGVETVVRIPLPDHPSFYFFEAQRPGRSSTYVLWEQRDTFSGEDQPPVDFNRPWPFAGARATDVLGQDQDVRVDGAVLRMRVSNTPIFIDPVH
jgi:hypothetical protein